MPFSWMFVRKIFGNYQSMCGGVSLSQNPMLSTYSSEPFTSGCVWCIKITIWDASDFIYSWNFWWKCIKSKTRQPQVLFRQEKILLVVSRSDVHFGSAHPSKKKFWVKLKDIEKELHFYYAFAETNGSHLPIKFRHGWAQAMKQYHDFKMFY